jgi:hypothetical protein
MSIGRTSVALLTVLLFVSPGLAQQNVPTLPLSTGDIVALMGNDTDARAMFITVLTHAMASGSRREFFLASQMREEWLPTLQGVELVRLSGMDIERHLAECGLYWAVSHLERTNNVVSLRLTQRCGGTGRHYIVSFDERGWVLGPPGTGKDGGGWAPGIGSGSYGRPPGCPCWHAR